MKLLLLGGAVMAAVVASRAAEPVRVQSGPAQVSLIELYTSEGCSSCPPADQWLSVLRNDDGLWRDFVPVAFHVDYWNRLGWPDRFSSRDSTQREHNYAESWQSGSVYTPCFVRDGLEWHSGGQLAPTGATTGTLSATYDGQELKAVFSPAGESGGGPFDIHAALLGGGISSKVTAGENRGETLKHEFVALAVAHRPAGDPIALPRVHPAGVSRYAIAVWVTRRGELTPLQAAGAWLE